MTEAAVLSIAKNAAMITLILAGPVLLASLIIGSLVSLFQSVTQINEATLTFIPKVIAIGLVLAFLGSWMLQQIVSFTANIFISLPDLVH
jgi:flagellar biosynthetic protein FliQ